MSQRSALRHRLRDGALIHVELAMDNIIYQEREACLVSINDITARIAAEARLNLAEQRYRSLFEEAPVMYVFDEQGQLVRTAGTAQDVTERKLAEEALPSMLSASKPSMKSCAASCRPGHREMLQSQL